MKAPNIPQKEFLQLAGDMKESASNGEFSWNDLKNCKDYYAVLEYLSETTSNWGIRQTRKELCRNSNRLGLNDEIWNKHYKDSW